MRTFNGIAEAADAARTAALSEEAPPEVLDHVYKDTGTGSSPVDLIVHFAEAVYAHADLCDAATKEIAGGCALLAEQFGFHGMNEGGRGSALALVLDGQTVADPPEVKQEYLAAPIDPSQL